MLARDVAKRLSSQASITMSSFTIVNQWVDECDQTVIHESK